MDNENTTIDPLITHCSTDLLQAQYTDSEIKQMKICLSAMPLKKPTPKAISQYGPKFKSLWSKWSSLCVMDKVLYLKWTNNIGDTIMRYVVPQKLRKKFFIALHAVPLGAHQVTTPR